MTGDDLDYILQAISNETRRKILKLLAEEPGLTYTKIMQRLGITDSGTLGFHMKKMKRLLRRSEFGEYSLSELGRKALEIIKRLEGGEAPLESEEKVDEEERIKIFRGHMNFEYTDRLAKRLKQRGEKAVFTDIMKLIIHPMDKELFEETVAQVEDVFICYVPADLYDSLLERSNEVFKIRRYKPGKAEAVDKEGVLEGFVDSLVEGIVSGVMGLVDAFKPKAVIVKTGSGRKNLGRKTLDERLPDVKRVHVNLAGGILNIRHGASSLEAWILEGREPDVTYTVVNGTLNLLISQGYVLLTLPDHRHDIIHVAVEDGYIAFEDRIKTKNMVIHINNGAASIEAAVEGGEAEVEATRAYASLDIYLLGKNTVNLDISNATMNINAKLEKKGVDLDLDVRSGFLDIKLNGRSIPPDYVTGGDNVFRGEINNSLVRMDIRTLE